MLRKSMLIVYLSVAVSIAGMALFFLTSVASAQSGTPEPDDACRKCHEDQYYLYDTGKWYCLCEIKPRCTYCHQGIAGAMDKETAHQGMIANPVQNNAATCQGCHPDEYLQRVDTFAAHGGIHSPQPPAEIKTPLVASLSPEMSLLGQMPSSPWQPAGLAAAMLFILGFLVFTVRCCLVDRGH